MCSGKYLKIHHLPGKTSQAIGYDGSNYWIYAGTGRLYGEKDKTDDGWCLDTTDSQCKNRSKNALFGFKEPLWDDFSGFDSWASPPSSIPTPVFTCDDKVMTWRNIDWDINKKTNDDLMHDGIVGERGLMQTDIVLVEKETGYLHCCPPDPQNPSQRVCTSGDKCFPDNLPTETVTVTKADGTTVDVDVYTFDKLQEYITGTGCKDKAEDDARQIQTGLDGWYHAFHDSRERNLGASALLGGLLTFTTYQPFNDKCEAEGLSYLYGIHFQTGTAWTNTVFGTFDETVDNGVGGNKTVTIVKDKMSLGRGMSTTPSMHVGSDGDGAAKAFIQTSTGEIIEVTQDNLPIESQTRSGRQSWSDHEH